MLAYNGSIPGPTLKVRQGSEIVVHVENHGDLDTTVHWHGLRLENRYDGVPHETQAPIPVGGDFTYRIQVPDPGCTGTTPTSGRTTPRSWVCTATSWSSPPTPTTGRRSTGSWS
jgi:FtsP/CotA-like multicopper oxidase with cupredoxin domain